MQIAIDGVPAAKPNKTGVEWYVYHLIREMNQLRPELDVGVYTHRPLDFELKGNWKNIVLNWPFLGWKHMWAGRLMVDKPQAVFSPGDGLPPYKRSAQVMTMHDLAFETMPEEYAPDRRRVLHKVHAEAAKRAAKIIAITDVTKQDVVMHYGVAPERIKTIPLAFDHTVYKSKASGEVEAVQSKYRLPKDYLVCVGRLDQRKGQADLIRTFLNWREDKEIDLVLIGGPGSDGYEEIHELAKHDAVHELGWASPEDVAAVVAGARAFAFATKKEGFGMPILEAMAVGTPVICSDLPVLREVGGDLPIFVDRESQEDWSRAFDAAVNGDVENRIARGKEHAAHYTWEQTARETLRVLCDTLSTNSK